MFSFKLLIAAAALICTSARHIVLEDDDGFYLMPVESLEDLEADELVPARTGRMRRQVHGGVTLNSDGTSGASLKIPLAHNDKNELSAIGAVDLSNQFKVAQSTAGLALDNVNGHGLTLTHSHIPGSADRVAAGAKLNLFHNDNHNLDAKAFAAHTMPEAAQFPNSNTYGGGAEYMYKNRVGAEVNMARTPLFDKTDYSAMGKLNLFHNKDTSLDFNAGLSKSVSPFIPKSSWEPNYVFSFKKWF